MLEDSTVDLMKDKPCAKQSGETSIVLVCRGKETALAFSLLKRNTQVAYN